MMLRFSSDHDWVRVEDDVVTVGITNYAQEQLGDIVYVELPDVGRAIEKGTAAAIVESVKAASEIYSPVAGQVLEINQNLVGHPEVVNSDPMGQGWFFKLRISDRSELDSLMDEAAYKAQIG